MCAGIFTNFRRCPRGKSLILSAISSPCSLFPVAFSLRTALYFIIMVQRKQSPKSLRLLPIVAMTTIQLLTSYSAHFPHFPLFPFFPGEQDARTRFLSLSLPNFPNDSSIPDFLFSSYPFHHAIV